MARTNRTNRPNAGTAPAGTTPTITAEGPVSETVVVHPEDNALPAEGEQTAVVDPEAELEEGQPFDEGEARAALQYFLERHPQAAPIMAEVAAAAIAGMDAPVKNKHWAG